MPKGIHQPKPNLFLVGPMGVGKTTIGKLLAEMLNLEFMDSDQEIEKRAGVDIAWIFDVEGEEGFRERESAVIDDLTRRHRVLIATGGGSVLRHENRDRLTARGVVVHLDISLKLQLERMIKDKKRPLLNATRRKAILQELRIKRDPIYCQISDIRYSMHQETSKRTVNAIMKKLKQTPLYAFGDS